MWFLCNMIDEIRMDACTYFNTVYGHIYTMKYIFDNNYWYTYIHWAPKCIDIYRTSETSQAWSDPPYQLVFVDGVGVLCYQRFIDVQGATRFRQEVGEVLVCPTRVLSLALLCLNVAIATRQLSLFIKVPLEEGLWSRKRKHVKAALVKVLAFHQ